MPRSGYISITVGVSPRYIIEADCSPEGWGDVNRIIIKYMFVPLIIIYVSLFKETHVINGGNIYA